MTNKDLADLIFPNINKSIEDYDKMYPERDLKEGARVTRRDLCILVIYYLLLLII